MKKLIKDGVELKQGKLELDQVNIALLKEREKTELELKAKVKHPFASIKLAK